MAYEDILLCPHSIELDKYFDCMNRVATTKKNQFTMEVAIDKLEVIDLKFNFSKEFKQISVDVFSKDTNSFTYVVAWYLLT